MGRRGRIALLFALSLALLTGALLLLFLGTEWGLARVRDGVMRAINAGIAGRLEIERFDQLTFGRVHARGVTIEAPGGKPAIFAERAVIDFSLSELLSGHPGWDRAEIEGCEVHVTEDESGKINMEETFESPKPATPPSDENEQEKAEKKRDEEARAKAGELDLDLRTMMTSRCVLHLGGGSLPTLRLIDLAGVMSVKVLANGDAALRFDDYRGTIDKGLPTGELVFRDVSGEVHTGKKKLLHFDGRGRSEGADVTFGLDIETKPTKVKIDARFPELSGPSLRAFAVGTWSKFSSSLDMRVHHGKE